LIVIVGTLNSKAHTIRPICVLSSSSFIGRTWGEELNSLIFRGMPGSHFIIDINSQIKIMERIREILKKYDR